LIAGPSALIPPPGVTFVPVVTSEEMRKAVLSRFSESDVLIMAAAVADFRPARVASGKIPKAHATGAAGLTLVLEPTPDILLDVAAQRTVQIVVGFAAETDDAVERARGKLSAKSLDLIVANDVTEAGAGFGTDTNRVTLVDRTGRCETLPLMPKYQVADRILDAVLTLPLVPGSSRLTP
jgi:phosphopantothenoylcysteine decarboxylase/phosphopantothenate--cysteine ligase